MQGKVALVTGGASGIGKGVARVLAQRGATVMVSGRTESTAAAASEELRAGGADADFVLGDVRVKKDMDRLVARTEERFGGLDIVVPSAGGNDDEARSPEVRGPFPEIDLSRVCSFVGEALSAKLLVVQAAVPAMRRRGGGSVVFVTSEGGRTPTPGQTAIAGFSAGLIHVAKLLSKELAEDRIRVNTVCVTVVRDSPTWTKVFELEDAVSVHHRKQYERILERAPFGIADPAAIGDVVGFLASDGAEYLTGATLSPTGGLTLQ